MIKMNVLRLAVIVATYMASTLHSAIADPTVCTETVAEQETYTVIETKTQIVATRKKCWVFWWCTSYRTAIVYYTAQRVRTRYGTTYVCCPGYEWNGATYVCEQILERVPDVPIVTTTKSGNPIPSSTTLGVNTTLNTTQPGTPENGTVQTMVFRSTTSPKAVSPSPSMSMTTPSNQSTGAISPNKASTQVPRGAIILISTLTVLVIVVFLVIVGCVVYRRGRRRRHKTQVDNLHMEPIRDVQLISNTNSIHHFSPPSAPHDKYAIVNPKKKKRDRKNEAAAKDDSSRTHGNTADKPQRNSVLNTLMKVGKKKNLVHTYMDGPMSSEESSQISGGDVRQQDNCYTEVDEPQADGAPSGECYTDIDNPGKPTHEVQEEYEAVGGVSAMPTYDHLDREPERNRLRRMKAEDHGDGHDVSAAGSGKYGVLVQTSSVETQEEYDIFHRSVSQKGQVPHEGYGSLDASASGSDNIVAEGQGGSYSNETYGGLDKGVTFTSRDKGRALLGKLRPGKDASSYGQLGSSAEEESLRAHSLDRVGSVAESEPIYENQARPSSFVMARHSDSFYTDMSCGSPVAKRSLRLADQASTECYIPMSPDHRGSDYYNVKLADSENPDTPNTHDIPGKDPGRDDPYSNLLETNESEYDHVQHKPLLVEENVPESAPKTGDKNNTIYENV